MLRESVHADILPIAFNMRESDVHEIWASNNLTPAEALEKGLKFSKPCMTAELKGEPIAMFGLVESTKDVAAIWFLSTPKAATIELCFGRLSKIMVNRFLKMYPILCNYVDERNGLSINWLKWLGAKFESPMPYGIMQRSFQFFTIQRVS